MTHYRSRLALKLAYEAFNARRRGT